MACVLGLRWCGALLGAALHLPCMACLLCFTTLCSLQGLHQLVCGVIALGAYQQANSIVAAWLALTYCVLLRCILTVLAYLVAVRCTALLVVCGAAWHTVQLGSLRCGAALTPGTSLACLAAPCTYYYKGCCCKRHKHLKVSCAGACVLCLVWFAYLFFY